MSWEYYFKPILAKGEGEKRPGSAGSLAAGSTDIPVDSASSYFSVGDPIFVTDTDLKNVSYCGKALSVDSDSVTVSLPTHVAYTTGTPVYYVITPSDFVILDADYIAHNMVEDLGVVNFTSSGGTLYRTKVRDGLRRYGIRWQDIELANRREIEDFIKDVLNYGLNDFTFVFWDQTIPGQRVMRARLFQGEVEFATKRTLMADDSLEIIYVGDEYE